MADDRPLPAPLQDGATTSAPVTPAASAAKPAAISENSIEGAKEFLALLEMMESFRILPEKGGIYVVTADKLAAEYLRVTGKVPTVAVIKVCHLVASQCRPMQSAKAVEMALNRVYGAVQQRLVLSRITPEEATNLIDAELNEALEKAGVPVEDVQ
jgi:hypothetical protein